MTYDPCFYAIQNPGNHWIFRWVFHFTDERPAKIGGWYPATRIEDMASTVNKKNLASAVIEGKHFSTKEIKRFAECHGDDFINFEHMAVCILRNGYMINHVYGMKLIARNEIFTATENGELQYKERTTENPFYYPEWTRV